MRKTMQKVMSFYLFLFLLPILLIKLPMLAFGVDAPKQVESQPVAYAANVTKEIPINTPKETSNNTPKETSNNTIKEISVETAEDPINVLLYFTHIQESYQPIVEKKYGLKAVNYHPTANISNVSDLVIEHFKLNGDSVDVLKFDNMEKMQISGAYSKIRPYLQKQLAENHYDVLLDLHRDSIKREKTTIKSDGTTYAQMTFVVGAEHVNYKMNEAFSRAVANEVNKLVPSISKGVLAKTHDTGNGIYNQDLSSHALLVELGGIENTEAEINRTIAVLAKAISTLFENNTAT